MRIAQLLGIRETGYDRAPWLPLDPRITLELYRSVDYSIPLLVVDTQGVPVDISTAQILLNIKKRPSDHNPVFFAQLVPGIEPGKGEFTIPAISFDWALEGSYVYEVVGYFGSIRDPLIPLSPLRLMPMGSKSSC